MKNEKEKSLETKNYLNVDTLSEDELYMLYFNSKLQKSQDDIKNGRVMTVEESKERMRKEYAYFNVE